MRRGPGSWRRDDDCPVSPNLADRANSSETRANFVFRLTRAGPAPPWLTCGGPDRLRRPPAPRLSQPGPAAPFSRRCLIQSGPPWPFSRWRVSSILRSRPAGGGKRRARLWVGKLGGGRDGLADHLPLGWAEQLVAEFLEQQPSGWLGCRSARASPLLARSRTAQTR